METRREYSAGLAAGESGPRPRRAAFSLIELLVVVGIITLLITTLLPSLRKSMRQAKMAVCAANLKQIGQAIELYKIDNLGWLPLTTEIPGVNKTDAPVFSAWFEKLLPTYMAEPATLACPDDPFRQWFPGVYYSGSGPLASSYGMNEVILNSSPGQFLGNAERYRPTRPLHTLLVGDMGPDALVSGGGPWVEGPNRYIGLLPVDDGTGPGYPNPPLPSLTQRHLGGMNVLMLEGVNVDWVQTRSSLTRPIQTLYPDCNAGGCTLCRSVLRHYSFAASQTFWWTGAVPTP